MVVIRPAGDSAVSIIFGDAVSLQLNNKIRAFCEWLLDLNLEGLVELVPAYDSVTVYYKPHLISYHTLCQHLNGLNESNLTLFNEGTSVRTIHVPVVYGGEFGPDLDRVGNLNNISAEEVIAIHHKQSYFVYLMGFLPGFPYLGGMDSRIAAPRRTTPRKHIAAGSVGIAHEQTGIYPIDSPGGWNIIGRTPLQLFAGAGDTDTSQQPFLFKAGDRVKFFTVTKQEYETIKNAVAAGNYQPQTTCNQAE